MSIEFNRRTFLKTSAALAGAAALVSLTGCDSSSSSHPINKKVDYDKTYEVDAIGVQPLFSIGSGMSGSEYYVTATFKVSNLSDADVTLGMDALSATYKGAALPFRSYTSMGGVLPTTDKSLILKKKGTTDQDFANFQITYKLPDEKASIDDVIVKLHYGKKSIKFQTKNKGADFYTSGVYKD